jgi:hypothetical protein
MSDNVPNDWGSYYVICPDCGARWHASEGYCSCIDDAAEQADDDAEQAEDGGSK